MLDDDVDVVVLEVFGYAGDEGHAYGQAEETDDAPDELVDGILAELGVVVDDEAEDVGVEEGEDLVGSG